MTKYLYAFFGYIIYATYKLTTFWMPAPQLSFDNFVSEKKTFRDFIGISIVAVFVVLLFFVEWYWAFVIANCYYIFLSVIQYKLKK